MMNCSFAPAPDVCPVDSIPPAPTFIDRDRLIIDHLPLVKAIASAVRAKLPSQVSLEDLIQAGSLGLIDAARRFSPDKACSFGSYAKHRIRGAILDSLRQKDMSSRDARVWQRRVEEISQAFSAEYNRDPKEEEIAEKLNVSVHQFRSSLLRKQGYVTISISAGWGEDLHEYQFAAPGECAADRVWGRSELNHILSDAVNRLPARYQSVIRLYYFEERTMREIGEHLGVNESRVSQMHRSAIGQLNFWLRECKIDSSAVI
jgi:RNA polymerase sigma factor for flagellar operon FliA